jgi:Tfp pilus assembly protein PilZ
MVESGTGPLASVESLLQNLSGRVEALHVMVDRLADTTDWESSIATEEDEVGDLLSQAEMTQDLTSMADAREQGNQMRGEVVGSFDMLVEGLRIALEQALEEATGAHRALESELNEATSALVQRKTALDVAATRARKVLEDRVALEQTVAADEEALSYEETRVFDESWSGQDDRRRHPRGALAVEVKLQDSGTSYAGSAENLSAGGLFISIVEEFELGALLHVSCTLSDGRVVRADGLVSWTRGQDTDVEPGIGVEFLAMTDEDRKLLEGLDEKQDEN